jgi:hypothetical protein
MPRRPSATSARREEVRCLVVAELPQARRHEARLVALAGLVERLGPGEHQSRVEEEVRRPLEAFITLLGCSTTVAAA